MANGKNTAAFIILSLLAVGGLGLSGYMFIEDQFLGGNEYVPDHEHDLIPHEHDMYNLVGKWSDLGGSGDQFNVTFEDIQLNNSEYFSLNTAKDTFTLLREGWYKFTVLTTWVSLDPSYMYEVYVQLNGSTYHGGCEMYYPATQTYTGNLIFFIYSGGNDYVNIFCTSADTFSVAGNSLFNEAYLEYIVAN